MSEPDAYYGTDRLQAEIEDISESRVTWLEGATIKLIETWKRQLDEQDFIPDLGWEYADIIAYCVELNLPYDKGLFDLAWNHLDQSDLYEELKWG